jgi:SecD/SecF fusion protein
MAKKIIAVAITAVLVLIWVATLHGVGPIGGKTIGPITEDMKLGLDIKGGVYVVMEAQTDETDPQKLDQLMNQTQSVIENRVNEMGLSEPVVTIEGENRIRVELPGAEDAEEAINTIGKTAQLRFLLADGSEALSGAEIENSGTERAQNSAKYVVTLEFSADGQQKFFEATTTAYNQTITDVMQPITADSSDTEEASDEEATTSDAATETADEAAAAEGVTKEAIAEATATGMPTYIDQSGNILTNPNGFGISANQVIIVLDNEIISAPSVNEPIDSRSAIIEEFTLDEATDLSMLIRGGALPADLKEVESSQIGASIGMGALADSVKGGIIGVLLVLILMLALYRIFGLAADIALLLYIPLVLWWLVFSGAVLTLPGIAGIVLAIGMAVDANVIIISRVREEVGNGKTLRLAQHDGYRKALSAVLDSQITTIIAAIVLYQLGTGPVKGFAFTLASGIIIGLITALFVANVYTQTFISLPFLRKPALLGVREGEADQHTQLPRRFNFIKHRKIFYIVTVVILAVGLGVGFGKGFNLGIDFTGGTRLQVDMAKQVSEADIEKTLAKFDITDAEIVYYTPENGKSGDGVTIKTTKFLDTDARTELGKAFVEDYDLSTTITADLGKKADTETAKQALADAGVTDAEVSVFTPEGGTADSGIKAVTGQYIDLDARNDIKSAFAQEFGIADSAVSVDGAIEASEQFGPSIGRMLTDKAIQAVLWAALFMLIYISVRFKWRYGVASLVAVFHDVAILIAMYGLFHITINNPFIAAVLTVVGYSINDTIVIFDRIRENFGLLSGRTPVPELIDTSINQTLIRSLMTSVSTLLAIVPLVILGGETIQAFAVPLMIGIIAGACSSIFIASPIYYELTRIGAGGEGIAGHHRARTRYEESVAQAKAAKRAKKAEQEARLKAEAREKGLKDLETKTPAAKDVVIDTTATPVAIKEGVCPSCGAEVPDGAKFCPECGTTLGPKGPSGGGKGHSKKSKKKRKSSRTGGAVV